jgi:Sap, sulfolipid-1-addressing protein
VGETGVVDVFVLAVISSLDAGLIAAAVVLLGRPRPASNLRAYLVGAMGFSTAFGVVILLALHGSGALRHPSERTSAIVEVAAGGLLITVAALVFSGRAAQWHPRRRRQPDDNRGHRRSLEERVLGHDSLWIAWAAGALYSAPGAYYLAGLALLAKLDRPAPINVVAIVAFNLIMFTFIELPLLGFLLAPDKTRRLAQQLSRWMTRHKRTLVGVAAGAGGAYLLVSGLSGLL